MISLFKKTWLGLSILSVGAACSEGPAPEQQEEERVIDRVPVPESRFKPVELEATIDGLIEDVVAEGATQDIALGVVLKDLFGFWKPVAVGANRAIGELEIPGSVQGVTDPNLTADEKPAVQLGFVEQQHDLSYQGLALAPFNDTLSDAINQWVAEGKPVVTIDSDLPSTNRQLYIGTDNQGAGRTGGETLIEILGGVTGRVIILGNDDPAWNDGYVRTHSAAETLAAAGNEVQIVHSVWSPAEAEVEGVLAAIADDTSDLPVVGLLGVFSNAHACATAVLQAGLETMPKVVAFDFEPQTLDYMEQGVIQATHAQRQYYMGYLSAYTIYSINVLGLERTKAALGNHLINGYHVDTGLDVIRSTELAEWNAFVDELGIE